MKHKLALFGLAVLAALLSGCANVQPAVSLPATYIDTTEKPVVGIAITPLPLANTVETGQIGLLDLAVIVAANKSLIDHLKGLDIREFADSQTSLAAELELRGFTVVRIQEPVDLEKYAERSFKAGFATRDFSVLKEAHGIDQLLLLQLVATGTTRSYYSIMPTSDPQAFAHATGQLIDLSNHQLLWYKDINHSQPIAGAWDEPDLKFPNVTNAVYQSIDSTRVVLRTDFLGPSGNVAAGSASPLN